MQEAIIKTKVSVRLGYVMLMQYSDIANNVCPVIRSANVFVLFWN